MDNNKFGQRLKELRKSKGYTQQLLAEKAGIDEKHLSRIENNRYFPTYMTLNKLLNALGVTVEEVGIELDNTQVNQNTTYTKALQILNTASSDDELKCYLEALRVIQKTLTIKKK